MTITYTDFHNHLIPGVDDGAQDADGSAGALAAFRRAHVRQVIVTPHFDGSLTRNADRMAARLVELDAGWARLREVVEADAREHGTPMRVERGAEVMLDIPDPNLDDARLRLAGTHFVLVEYPSMQLPAVNAPVVIGAIRRDGWVPVIAHPERYRNLQAMSQLNELLSTGALLQVNAGSLLGEYGRTAQRNAAEILAAGLASFVCADYHARGAPATARFARALSDSGFESQAELLLAVNPGRLLNDEMPLDVAPIATKGGANSWWKRLLGR
jgi:protein-tyrosine phosphatase